MKVLKDKNKEKHGDIYYKIFRMSLTMFLHEVFLMKMFFLKAFLGESPISVSIKHYK